MSACADGATYDHTLDHSRLTAQRERVWRLIQDGTWYSLSEISTATGDPEASVSARLRDFRKPKFGGYTIERRRHEHGLYYYRLAV